MALDAGNKIINTNTGLVADGYDISGGYFSISSLDSIPEYSKVLGALCYVTSGTNAGKYFKYNGTNWVEAEFGGGNVTDVTLDGTSVVTNKVAVLTTDSALASAKLTGGIGWTESGSPTVTHKIASSYINTIDATASGQALLADGNGGVTWGPVGEANLVTDVQNENGQSLVTNKIATIDFSTKQDKIDSSHKLSADLISDGTTNVTVTQTNKTNWNTAYTNTHSHGNKNLLDTYDQTNANISDAVTKKHSHSNSSVLDSIAQTDISNWNAKQDSLAINPGGTTTTLTSLGINNINYQLESGDSVSANEAVIVVEGGTSTVVAANPADTATASLTKLKVGETTYSATSINDSSTSSTTETWSANKLNTTVGNIESLLEALR